MRRLLHAALITAAACVPAACSGGGSQAIRPVVSPSPNATKPGTAKSTTVTLQFTIPKKTTTAARSRAGTRKPKWISASTEGAQVGITVTNPNSGNQASSTQAFNLVPAQSPYCSPASDGTTACSLPVQVPGFGTAVISVELYDTPPNSTSPYFPAGANLLSSGTIGLNNPISITEGAPTVVPLVLSGLVSSAEAGAVTTLPANGGVASFVLQSRDADGNLILAADGTEDPTQNTSTGYGLLVPPSISSVTLSDATNSSLGSGTQLGSAYNSVKMGDTIVVTATGATNVAGIPIEVLQYGGYVVDIGQVYVPVATGASVATSITLTAHGRIAGAAYTSEFPPNGHQADGFVVAYGQSIYAYNVTPATSVATQAAGGTLYSGQYSSPTTTDLTVIGIAPSYASNPAATNSSVYATITDANNGQSLNQIDLQYSSLSGNPQSPLAGGYTSAEIADIGNLMGVALSSSSSLPLDFITFSDATTTPVTAPYTQLNPVPSNWTSIGIVGSINGTASFKENATFSIVAGSLLYSTNVLGTLTSTNLPGLSGGVPVSLVGRGPFIFILTSIGEVLKCVVGGTPTCASYSTMLEAHTPSSDPHAMALGPDGALWVATQNAGIERLDPNGTTVTTFGTGNYDQIVASADGKLYATKYGTGEIDAIP